jgi:hypothetical protein
MGELGLGWEALVTICDILNIGPLVYSDSAYQKHNQSVNLATRKVLEERLNIGAAGRNERDGNFCWFLYKNWKWEKE